MTSPEFSARWRLILATVAFRFAGSVAGLMAAVVAAPTLAGKVPWDGGHRDGNFTAP